MDHYKRFNKCAKQLYKDLLNILPTENCLLLANAAFVIFKNMDKKNPAKYFYNEVVAKYKNELDERNEAFFIDGPIVFPYFDSFTERLREIWRALSEADKSAIWDHLSVLTYLATETQT